MVVANFQSAKDFKEFYAETNKRLVPGLYQYAERELIKSFSQLRNRPVYLMQKLGNEVGVEFFNVEGNADALPYLVYLEGEHYKAIILKEVGLIEF